MAIEIIDILGQKNNGDFPLVDSNDIKGGYYQVDTIEERNSIPLVRRKEGMLCYVKNDKIYQLIGGVDNSNWTIFNAGGSGSGFSGDYNDLINKPDIPVVDVDKAYVDNRFDNIEASSIHIVDNDGNYQNSDVEGCLKEISDTLNEKVDDIILTDDNFLNFYANDILIKSIKIESNSQTGSEDLVNTKIDDVVVETLEGITYMKLFANGVLLKTIEIKTSGDSLIHVGADEPTFDNCEVWVDVSDDEEFSSKIEDALVDEIKSIISSLQGEINTLKKIIVAHEARIEYLELNGGGSSGGSGGEDEDDSGTTTRFTPLTFEGGEVLILEDETILTFEDLNY